jgi:hypothetical protein
VPLSILTAIAIPPGRLSRFLLLSQSRLALSPVRWVGERLLNDQSTPASGDTIVEDLNWIEAPHCDLKGRTIAVVELNCNRGHFVHFSMAFRTFLLQTLGCRVSLGLGDL